MSNRLRAVRPPLLFRFMKDIIRHHMADQQRGPGIMFPQVFTDGFRVVIGIAVPAEMPAGIVSPDIAAQITGTCFSCRSSFNSRPREGAIKVGEQIGKSGKFQFTPP